MTDSKEVVTHPDLERRTRRQFGGAEKQRLLAEAEALPHGDKGAWLRRNGLYAGQLSTWRKTLAAEGANGLTPKATGRKPKDSRDRRIEQLERELTRQTKRTRIAEDLVDLQKKFFALVEEAQSESSR